MKRALFLIALLVLAAPSIRAQNVPATRSAPVDHDHDGDGHPDHAGDHHDTAHPEGEKGHAHGHDGTEPWARPVVIRSVRNDTVALAGAFAVFGVYTAGTRRRRDGGAE